MVNADVFWAKVDRRGPNDCWPWLGAKMYFGYGAVRRRDPRGFVGAHRVALMHSGVSVPAGKCVLHSCDNPPCCNPAHLRVGTQAENIADRGARGRTRVGEGERHHSAKLTVAGVKELRRLYAGGTAIKALSDRFGVAPYAIQQCVRRDTWKSVA